MSKAKLTQSLPGSQEQSSRSSATKTHPVSTAAEMMAPTIMQIGTIPRNL